MIENSVKSEEAPLTEITQDVSRDISLHVVLHNVQKSGSISSGRTNENILGLFEKTQAIWNQADIEFVVELRETFLDENLQTSVDNGDFLALFPLLADDKKLHIFFVDEINGSNGIAAGPRLALVADVTSVKDFRATAHEIGHLLGLRHTIKSSDRLMFQGVNGAQLVASEISIARQAVNKLEDASFNLSLWYNK